MDLDFTSSTVRAYIATEASAGTVTFRRVYRVPANTPLLLKADNTETLTELIPELEGTAEDVSDNLLQGSATNSVTLASDDTRYYVYGTHAGKAAFYYASSINSQAGKAYLPLTAVQAGAASRVYAVFDESVTEVETLKPTAIPAASEVYTLGGQRVGQPSKKGVYIVNGRKVVVR